MKKKAPKGKRRISIGFKLVTIISLLLVIALGGMVGLATWFFKNDNELRIQEGNHRLAQLSAARAESELRAVLEKGTLIAAMLEREKQLDEADRIFARLFFDQDKNLIFTGIAESAGGNPKYVHQMVNGGYLKQQGVSVAALQKFSRQKKEYFQRSFDSRLQVHNASAHFQEPVLCITAPYGRSGRNKARTILVIYLKVPGLMDTVRSDGLTRSFMVNGDGELLLHSDSGLMLSGVNMKKNSLVRMMLKSPVDNGQRRYQDKDNRWMLGAYKRIQFSGIGVAAAVAEDKAFAAVYQIQRRNLLIMVITLSLAVLIVFFFAKTLTRPIQRLVEGTRQIQAGAFDLQLPATTRDEIGTLTESFNEMGQGLAEREKMKDAFGRFVNKDVAEQAMRGELKLGGERKDVAIFFSDIRSFTAISEQLEPEEVVEFLNEYMTRMVHCVEQTFGVVDKFIGDAIMAVWGTPISKGNDAANSIRGALMMRAALLDFNKDRGGVKKPLIRIGCGINIGPVIAGQIGSQQRMEYTVIGDAVNLASRIEGLNKPFGTDILISEDTLQRVDGMFNVVPMQKIKVKGKSEPQQIYAVLGEQGDNEAPQTLEELRELLGVDMSKVSDKKVDPEAGEQKYEILE